MAIKKHKSFTLIEMVVTVGIIVLMVGISTVSLSSGQRSSEVTTQAEEVQGLVEELKAFAYGPERERANHYILIIETENGPRNYCNKGLSSNPNKLTKNQYMLCETEDKVIYEGYPTLNGVYSRVRAGSLNKDLNITKSADFTMSGPPGTVSPIVINMRTYDGQMGYKAQYCDHDSACANPNFTLTLAGQSKQLTLNSILGTLQ